MKKSLSKLIINVLVACLIVSCLQLNMFGYFLVNGSGEVGYSRNGQRNGLDMENYVIQGAGSFLNGYSNVQTFLAYYETQSTNGVDYNEWLIAIDNALYHMNNAVNVYELLIAEADTMPYNQESISALHVFDYPGFMQANSLNSEIFAECEGYLKQGNITGMYRHIHEKLQSIVSLLSIIQTDLSGNKMPGLMDAYALNEACLDLSMFGQYASRVFYTLPVK